MRFLNSERLVRGGFGRFLPQPIRATAFLVWGWRVFAPVMDAESIPGCILVLLLAVLTIEFQLLRSRYAEPLAEQHRPGPLQMVQTASETDPDLQADMDETLARPVFSKTRRQSQASRQSESLRLTGVVVSTDTKVAIFTESASGKSILVREGGRIGDYVVEAITAGQAMVQGPDGGQVLHPRFDTTASNSRAAAWIEDVAERPVSGQVTRGPVVSKSR